MQLSQGKWKTNNRLYLVITLSVLWIGFSVFVFNKSMEFGRLASVPFYDECVYFLQGAEIIEKIRINGLSKAVMGFNEMPLHSPYSTLVSALVLSISHYNTTLVYFSGAFVVLAGMVLCYLSIHKQSSLVIFLLILIALTWPVFTIAACEFRPDSLWGILLAILVISIITLGRNLLSLKGGTIMGAVCAAALLTKPSAFALTLIIFSSAFCLRLAKEKICDPEFNFKNGFSFVVGSFIVCSILTIPYVYLHGVKIWEYFYQNVFGRHAGLWEPDLSQVEKFMYYIRDVGFGNALGISSYILSGLSIIALYFIMASKNKNIIINSVALIMVSLLCYAIVSLGNIKSVFIGSPFYFILLGVSLYLVSTAISITRIDNKKPVLLVLGLAVIAVISIYTYKWPETSFVHPSLSQFRVDAHNMLVDILDENDNEAKIYFYGIGPVIPENVGLHLLSRGVNPELTFKPFNPPESLKSFQVESERSNVIVVADESVVGSQNLVPFHISSTEVKEFLINSEDFEKKGVLSDHDGKEVAVFLRK